MGGTWVAKGLWALEALTHELMENQREGKLSQKRTFQLYVDWRAKLGSILFCVLSPCF